MSLPHLVTTGYAAHRLGLTDRRVQQLCQRKQIPHQWVRGWLKSLRVLERADVERLAVQKATRPNRSKWWVA